MSIVPFAWRDRPSLIEHILPAQKVSAEAQKERKAGAGQTLTALGSYWKGRKPLILVKACVLGSLLPATENQQADLDIFEKLMAMDDLAFLRRGLSPSCLDVVTRLYETGIMSASEAECLFEIRSRKRGDTKVASAIASFGIGDLKSIGRTSLFWRETVSEADRRQWELRWVQSHSYLERVSAAKRPDELDQGTLFAPVWYEVNAHLGTDANNFSELIEQLGILRFGKLPKIGDSFCGGGSIPFESARLGCNVYASDLNPIACMLTWGALNILGASESERRKINEDQSAVAAVVDQEVTKLGIEHDRHGNRAKAFLYCLEVRCPQTGWLIPAAPSWVVSTNQNAVAKLVPNHSNRRFNIEILSNVTEAEMAEASQGTIVDGHLVYKLGDDEYRTSLKTIRGESRRPDESSENRLRRWKKSDFLPLPDDVLQERLYCIQWIERDTLGKSREATFLASVNDEDMIRERKVEDLVRANLSAWQAEGLIPDMPIEPGYNTDQPIRERGWTYWHHLFSARQLLLLSSTMRASRALGWNANAFAKLIDRLSKCCRWDARNVAAHRDPTIQATFYNQAFNTLFNYGVRAWPYARDILKIESNLSPLLHRGFVATRPASEVEEECECWITDPPYADAIRYEEITEYFIAWLRKNPPVHFDNWVWDSRRLLAIKGTGDEFRREMTAAYAAMSQRMPDYGLQIVMFTHQDAGVWADMASIVWGAGLQVTAAWYIATETTSELKKGGYVQGTVLLVLRKRRQQESAYRDELVQEVRAEVAKQIETMTGLNQTAKGSGRSENLFEDQDLQMAGYAAALRVLTGYSRIDGQDMAAEALRPRPTDGSDLVKEIIDFAVQVANEHLVPEGIAPGLWERLTGPERFYLRMLDIEAGGTKKLDNYQNFAKAFRYGDYSATMGSMKANDARLKTALEFKRSEFEGDFGKSALRAVLFALYELQRDVDIDEAISHLRDLVPGYLSRREDLMALATVIAAKRETRAPAEAQAARILFSRIKNERLG